MPTVERRQDPRVAVRLPLRFTFAGKTIDARVVDLSNSGIRFHTPEPLPVLSRMQITMELPEAKPAAPITIIGVVVWCAEVRGRAKHPFDAAIFFEEVSPVSARARLKRFVGEHLAPA